MTDTAEETATPAAPPPRAASRLAAAARAGRPARKTTPRKAPAKTATRPATSRNARAAARGKYSERIIPMVKLGSAAFRDPVQQALVLAAAAPWAASVDRLAAEDPRVDALLSKVTGIIGTGGAWGEFGLQTATLGGALLVAGGRVPAGPVGVALAMVTGQMIEAATMSAATDLAADEAATAGLLDADGFPSPHPGRIAEIAASLTAARIERTEATAAKRKKPRKSKPSAPADDAELPADDVPTTGPGASDWILG